MATERERKTQEKTMSLLRKYGCYVYKNAQNMYTEKGRPDLTACVPVKVAKLEELLGADTEIGIFVGIEMKRPGLIYDTSEAQEIVGRKIQGAKGLWMVVDDPKTVETLLIKLRGQI